MAPTAWILQLPVGPRGLLAIALAFAPVFFANLAFAKRFADTADSTTAFATNILGAMVGGCLEYLALMVGYRNLLVVAGLLYLAALALGTRAPRRDVRRRRLTPPLSRQGRRGRKQQPRRDVSPGFGAPR